MDASFPCRLRQVVSKAAEGKSPLAVYRKENEAYRPSLVPANKTGEWYPSEIRKIARKYASEPLEETFERGVHSEMTRTGFGFGAFL